MKNQIVKTAGLFILALSLTYTGCKKEDTDNVNPTVEPNGGTISYSQINKPFSDPGASATDETDGTLTATGAGSVNTSVAGTYIITYTATDAAGNTGTATRTVYVVNFDGNYDLVQSGCTDPAANGTGSSLVSASGVTAVDRINIQNFGLYSALNASATFNGTSINVANQASATGVSGDRIEATGSISGTGTASNPVKFTFQFTEKDATGATFNTGTAVFTHN